MVDLKKWSSSKLALVGLIMSIACIALYIACIYYLIMYFLDPASVESWVDILLIGILFNVATDLEFIIWSTICFVACLMMAYCELRRIILGESEYE